MRNLLLLGLGLLLIGTTASASEFTTAEGPSYVGTRGTDSPVTLSQMVDNVTIDPVGVACGNAGISTTQNWYLRRFFLNTDHGLTSALTVFSVDIGVQQLEMADGSPPPTYPIELNLYTIPSGDAFLFGNMTLQNSLTVPITAADIGTIVNVPLIGFIANPVATDLVIAIDAPDGGVIGAGLQFRPGANGNGLLAGRDAYLAAADCGITEPTAVSAIGFPDSQFIMVVNGDSGTVAVEQSTWGKVKAIYN